MIMQQQFRRYHEGFEDEGELIPGEPLWDDVRGRFGIFGGDNRIHWFPVSTLNKYVVESGKPLTVDAPTAPELAWIDGAFVIRTKAGVELARFSTTGVTLANATIAGVYPAGTVNEVINGGFQCDRAEVTSGRVVNTGVREMLFAPNWMLWCGAQANSELVVGWDTTDLPPVEGVSRVLRVNVGGNGFPASAGVRTFAHDTRRLRKASTATAWLKGPVGAVAAQRVLGSRGLLRYEPLAGTGAWKQYLIDIDSDGVDPLGENWAAFDALYCPTAAGSDNVWRVGPTEWNAGEVTANLPLNNTPDEQQRVNAIYAEPAIRGTSVYWQLLREYTRIIGSTASIGSFDHTGATLTEVLDGRLVAARLPPVPAI